MEISLDDHTSRCLEVLSKINDGELGKDLAKEYKVQPSTITKWKKKALEYLKIKDTKKSESKGNPKATMAILQKPKQSPKYTDPENGIRETVGATPSQGVRGFNTNHNSPGSVSTAPAQPLTSELIEMAIVDNLFNPDAARTQAINLARQFLETKERLNIRNKEEESICQSLKQKHTSDLIQLMMPRKENSSSESLPQESLQLQNS